MSDQISNIISNPFCIMQSGVVIYLPEPQSEMTEILEHVPYGEFTIRYNPYGTSSWGDVSLGGTSDTRDWEFSNKWEFLLSIWSYDGCIGGAEISLKAWIGKGDLENPIRSSGIRNALALGWKLTYQGKQYFVFHGAKKAEDYKNSQLPREVAVLKFEGSADLKSASVVVMPHGNYGLGGKAGFAGDQEFFDRKVSISISDRISVEKDSSYKNADDTEKTESVLMNIGIVDFGDINVTFWNQLYEQARNCLIVAVDEANSFFEGKKVTQKVTDFLEIYASK